MIPLSDDSRRPVHFPIATVLIIGVIALVLIIITGARPGYPSTSTTDQHKNKSVRAPDQ